jgi:hypothetical protein
MEPEIILSFVLSLLEGEKQAAFFLGVRRRTIVVANTRR